MNCMYSYYCIDSSFYSHCLYSTVSFLAFLGYRFQPTVLTVALMLQCCVHVSSVCDVRIVAKQCVLEQKLILTAYRKSYMRSRLVPK